ncbi:hypothetical protein TcG_03683 [Trypanosoma cruzi]|nr:hypothetical protein TcG_03683 [Trypanosoma cruzi]
MRTTPSRGWPGLSWIDGGPDRKNGDRCCAERAEFMDKRRPLATCAPQKVSQDKKERQKTARGRPPLMKADDGGHAHSATHHQTPQKTSHRTADASSDRPNCPTRSTRRAEGAARETCAPSTWEQRMPPAGQFTAFRRTHEQPINEESRAALFCGNIRCGAADPTAASWRAAVHVANGSNPAGHDDYGATKTSGEIGEEAGAPFDKGGGGSICPQPDRLERTCCFSTCMDNGEPLVRDCGLHSQQFHTGAGRNHNFGLVRGAEDGESRSPPRLAVRRDTRAGRVRHYKVMQDTSRKRKAHESYDRQSRTSSGSLECHGAFHKTRCVAARCSNRGDIQFGSSRDLAVGGARRPVRPFPEYCLIFGEIHHTADPGIVAGRIDVKGETAEGQEPWLRAEERLFSHDFYRHRAKTKRTRLALPKDERIIPLQQANVSVLRAEWIQSRLNPATLERLMQVWGLVGRSVFLYHPAATRAKAHGRFRSMKRDY